MLELVLRVVAHRLAVPVLVVLVVLAVLRALLQGRSTSRERDLHDRTLIVTGAFSPLGLCLLQALAQRGARIIALTPEPLAVAVIVSLLRTTTSNEHIFAEQCDLNNPADIHTFCTQFLTKSDTRLDGLIFAHEYQHIGVPSFLRTTDDDERDEKSLATFLMTTLLLPALLVAPVERDIRILTVVNPFYAAASTSFSPTFPTPTPSSIFLAEGHRSLRTIILTRHLQRIFDALPKPQIPKAETNASSVPVVSGRMQKSNLVAVSVSPGISRLDTVSRLLNADWKLSGSSFSWFGLFLYILFAPVLYLTTKSPKSSIQSVLHALFLPTPFKVLSSTDTPIVQTELLKPGALYADCATVKLDVPVPSTSINVTENDKEGIQIEEDGEYGGEKVGRWVWEAYETGLKVWDKGKDKSD
ncbi:hypothetical protein AGABI1DRAFT_37986 [Agaricus bisporus var. burnettii JB137-S8]|uniref:Ketoreductase (KR) domain-containing protein n=1 Tax=Agaricus bisporus var. burnettii (strain JB137-S8 / ATCC MYA-4627 / FGSC 10392) TaxID=597362 RepID=K5W3K1_AGABU|nr:uncharacterized protein AGABI1DRAFT_37986 [Agaricus bisporus var. burnettii JB137-S8]EKM81374.1 hypothetical protein AGABI1DRAFT_37986 [Agaricus bisporus var. burnettii JB137-S8]